MAAVPRDRYFTHGFRITVLKDPTCQSWGHAKIASGFYRDGMTIEEFVVACEEAGLGHRMKPMTFAKRCLRRDQRAGVIRVDRGDRPRPDWWAVQREIHAGEAPKRPERPDL